jgi:anti-sigma28 factor (negative regulator of flagellin synthesis)
MSVLSALARAAPYVVPYLTSELKSSAKGAVKNQFKVKSHVAKAEVKHTDGKKSKEVVESKLNSKGKVIEVKHSIKGGSSAPVKSVKATHGLRLKE